MGSSVSRQRRMSDARTKPDNISIQPHPAKDSNPIRPISAQNHSPTMSHRSFKIPPDGYIPIAGANSVISLPPPHELSMPVPLAQPSATATNSDSKQARNKATTSRSSDHADREGRTRTPLSIGGASTSQHTLSRKRRMNGRPTPIDPKSEASTIISDLGLLGPPDDIGRNEDQDVDYFNQGMRSYSRPSFQTERAKGKSRCVNPDITPTPSRPVSPALDQYDESTSRMLGNFKIEASHYFLHFHFLLYWGPWTNIYLSFSVREAPIHFKDHNHVLPDVPERSFYQLLYQQIL